MYWQGNSTLRYFLSRFVLSMMDSGEQANTHSHTPNQTHKMSAEAEPLFISNDKWNNSPEPSTIINHCNSDLPLN